MMSSGYQESTRCCIQLSTLQFPSAIEFDHFCDLCDSPCMRHELRMELQNFVQSALISAFWFSFQPIVAGLLGIIAVYQRRRKRVSFSKRILKCALQNISICNVFWLKCLELNICVYVCSTINLGVFIMFMVAKSSFLVNLAQVFVYPKTPYCIYSQSKKHCHV